MSPTKLVEEYQKLSSQEEKAEFEYTLWRHYKGIQSSKKAAKTVTQTLGITDIQYRTRRSIYKLPSKLADPLWNKLEDGMPFHTIYRIITTAKKRPEPIDKALAIELNKYEKKSYTARLPNGKQIKKKFPILKKETEIGIGLIVRENGDKPFWAQIKMMITDHLGEKLGDLLEIERDNLLREFEIDLKTLIMGWQSRVARATKSKIKFGTTIDRKRLIRACKILQIDPPPVNQPVDLKRATNQMRKLTRLYHPDVHGGREDTRDLFEEAVGAHEILKEYNDSLDKEKL
jgi:hypothetical protein